MMWRSSTLSHSKGKSTTLWRLLPLCLLMGALCACHHIDDDRIPPASVYIPFITQGQWETYGVSGVGNARIFIKSEKRPADFPYTALCQTGFGGVLLVNDYNGQPVAYDLACPVECRNTVRVAMQPDTYLARCPVCGSEYEVCTLNYGYPVSGPAAADGYGLQVYRVIPGSNGEYRIITR